MRKRVATFKPVMAAEDDMPDVFDVDDTDGMQDAVEDMSDTLEDIQDTMDEIDDAPQDTVLNMRNNIENHYIAECDRCHDIFISAVQESDSPVESVEGECPCCHEHTKQRLKWIVRDVNFDDSDSVQMY